jgi:hypothetical protein
MILHNYFTSAFISLFCLSLVASTKGCLELHLKKVVFKNYDGNKRSPIGFAKFFILNA